MIFELQTITLKDGRICVLRPAQKEDAQGMIDYMRTSAGETPFLLRNPDEMTFTVESEESFLEGKKDAPRELMMVAEVDGVLAGNCAILTSGVARRLTHRCGFAIALLKNYWHLGIASSMMTYAFELAKEMGYEQVELEVVEGNERAKALYEHLGFQETGKHLHALKYDDGNYRDEYTMVKFL